MVERVSERGREELPATRERRDDERTLTLSYHMDLHVASPTQCVRACVVVRSGAAVSAGVIEHHVRSGCSRQSRAMSSLSLSLTTSAVGLGLVTAL